MRPAVGDDLGDRRVDRGLRLHVELDRAQIDAVFAWRSLRIVGDLRRVAAGGVAHRGVDGVAGLGERSAVRRPKPLDAPVTRMTLLGS